MHIVFGSAVFCQDAANEVWTPSPSLKQITENSPIWCRMKIEKSSNGRVRSSCDFGFVNKTETELKFMAVIEMPLKDGLIYGWKIEGNWIIISDTLTEDKILQINLDLFHNHNHTFPDKLHKP